MAYVEQTPTVAAKQRHTAFQQLPVVDVAGLAAADLATRRSAAQALGQAARDAGFLYITGHGVGQSVSDDLIQLAKAYFAQPHAAKMRDYIGLSNNHSGYVPEGEEQLNPATKDTKESFDVGFDYLGSSTRPMLGANRWTEFAKFKPIVKAYYEAVFALSKRLFAGFALALGLPEDRFASFVTAPPSQLRLIHYPYDPQVGEDRPGIGAHTDYECFTILLPTAPGLEVLNGAGEWIDAPVVPGAFVINIGDMLEVLTNGEFVATSHRVRKVAEERYSFPLFCACDYDTVISPLPELLDKRGVRGYEPLTCGEHLYAQTLQSFHYMKQRLARGEVTLPTGARGLYSFGHSAGKTS